MLNYKLNLVGMSDMDFCLHKGSYVCGINFTVGYVFPFLRIGTGFSRILQFPRVSILPSVLITHISFVYHIIYRIIFATKSVFISSTKH
jgi:hypothetical protein